MSVLICFVGKTPGVGTPIHNLYGDVPPFRVWFFDCPLINRISNSKIPKIFYKKGLKITHFDEKMTEIINRVSIFQDFHEHFIINRVGVSRSGRHPPTQT